MRVAHAAWCALFLLLPSACSRTLPFNFSFTTDAGSSGNDLAVNLDLAMTQDQSMSLDDLAHVDLVNHLDQSISEADLAASTDLATDLRVVTDLRVSDQSAPDLVTFDQAKVRSPIGGPCITGDQCASGLFCATQLPVGTTTIEVPGGYCTKECTGVDALECTADAKCYDFGDKSYCVRGCDALCPVARNIGANNYGCCSYQDTSGPTDPPPVLIGCLPLSIAGQSGYSCIAGNP